MHVCRHSCLEPSSEIVILNLDHNLIMTQSQGCCKTCICQQLRRPGGPARLEEWLGKFERLIDRKVCCRLIFFLRGKYVHVAVNFHLPYNWRNLISSDRLNKRSMNLNVVWLNVFYWDWNLGFGKSSHLGIELGPEWRKTDYKITCLPVIESASIGFVTVFCYLPGYETLNLYNGGALESWYSGSCWRYICHGNTMKRIRRVKWKCGILLPPTSFILTKFELSARYIFIF